MGQQFIKLHWEQDEEGAVSGDLHVGEADPLTVSHAGVRTGGPDGLSDARGTGHVCDGSEAGGKRRTTDGFQTGRVDQKSEVVSQPLGEGKGTEAHAQGQPRLDIVS